MSDSSDWTSPTTGIWAALGHPATTAALAVDGIDWICLDAQHGAFDDRAMLETLTLLRALPQRRVTTLVRVAAARDELIGRALDGGADGVIVPMVSSAGEALECVTAAFYPPIGRRSWGPMHASAPTPNEANDRMFVAAMVETAAALDEVAAIAATPHLGMVFVGPFDLALALGFDVDEMVDDLGEHSPLQRVVGACHAAGIAAGVFGGTPERARRLRRHGFDAVSVSTDDGVVTAGAAAAVRAAAVPREL
ncbi:HpcH/HpaI aldolase/citrate lyase family protein [Herbiconiux sp. P17]|uniref:HpcH/HpaI aldolase family protein n=1 Tax=Herbiconiux wuyangfengii TaxID=3342794 RepID=UPI0035B7D326